MDILALLTVCPVILVRIQSVIGHYSYTNTLVVIDYAIQVRVMRGEQTTNGTDS